MGVSKSAEQPQRPGEEHRRLPTYPSHYEGFGNAFLEAIYFRKPVVVISYAVYARDIDPLATSAPRMSRTTPASWRVPRIAIIGNYGLACWREMRWGSHRWVNCWQRPNA